MVPSSPEPSPPVNVTITQTSCNNITVHWTPPADNGNAAITEYRVLVYEDSDPHVTHTNDTTMKLSYQVISLQPKTDYTVEVQAGNDGGFGYGSRANFTTGKLTGCENATDQVCMVYACTQQHIYSVRYAYVYTLS